jgi:hypothetical protein
VKRIRYSRAGFVRRVMMSRDYSLFVVVEGSKIDRHYYGMLCENDDELRNRGYLIRLIQQVHDDGTSPSGGKQAIIGLYDYCRRRKVLRQETSHGVRSIAFALDADLDRVTGTTKRSPHVIYTQSYNVETDILRRGDDARALALALSLPPPDARELAKDLGTWRDDLAALWRDWITLCCEARFLHSHCSVGIAHSSAVNHDTYGAVDLSKVARARHVVVSCASCDSSKVAGLQRRATARVRTYYSQGDGGSLIPGKLLVGYLESRIRDEFSGNPIDLRGFRAVAVKSYLASLDFHAPWALEIRSALLHLIR